MRRSSSSSFSTHASLFLLFLSLAVGAGALSGAETQSGMQSFMERRGYICVPLRHTELNAFRLKGKVAGSEVVITVDTGAPVTDIDKRKATKLTRLGKQKTTGKGLFGFIPSEIELVSLDSLQLGKITVSNVTAKVRELRHPEVHTGSHIATSSPDLGEDVLLGMNVLAALHTIMDCGNPAALYVRPTAPDPELARTIDQSFCQSGYTCTSLGFDEGWLLVPATLNNSNAQFVLDTGAPATQVDNNQMQAFHLASHSSLGTMADIDAHRSELDYAVADSFRIGSYERRKFPVGVIDLRLPNAWFEKTNQPAILGLIGPDLLTRAGALIDCSGRKLYLRPGTN